MKHAKNWQFQFLPLNNANQESDITVDNNEIMYSQKRPNDNYIVSSLSLAKEHRKLLSILPPVGHPSLSDSISNSKQQSFSSLESTIVRGGTHWNSKFGETSGSSSKFTAVIFTQLSAASPVVRYNAPIFKLVSNVASSEYVEKVSRKKFLFRKIIYLLHIIKNHNTLPGLMKVLNITSEISDYCVLGIFGKSSADIKMALSIKTPK